jgi:hypothetical protein
VAIDAPAKVVAPVPPFAIGRAVPDNVIANVPVVVIGEPATDKNDGTVAATLVTVPVAGVAKDKTPEPLVCITCVFVPSADGKVKVTVPEAGAFNVIVPAPA